LFIKLEINQGYTTMHGQPIIKSKSCVWIHYRYLWSRGGVHGNNPHVIQGVSFIVSQSTVLYRTESPHRPVRPATVVVLGGNRKRNAV